MTEKTKQMGRHTLRYNQETSEIYCEKEGKWIKSRALAFNKKIPARCGSCKDRAYWKPK